MYFKQNLLGLCQYIVNLSFILLFANNIHSQDIPFTISLEAIDIPQLGGIQSYAFGQSNGKWLIIGGCLDGLHRRQPWASFDLAGHNNQILVIDPIIKKRWVASLSILPTPIQEQLSSTNMEFYQEGDYLFCVGGYGYSELNQDHITHNKLTVINVPELINDIIGANDYANHFRQITDANFQVTGGRLRKMGDKYYLLGGQKFMGRYNPMGPDHGPGFEQVYTDAIRIFNIEVDQYDISVTHHEPYFDRMNLHRRDYNAEPQIFQDGSEGITMFSGVFQHDVDLPFLNAVNVNDTAYQVEEEFQQLYNHYHCPTIPLYSEEQNRMYTLFFGGIAQYYQYNGSLIQDNTVPFVKTIASVVRDENGKMSEHLLPVEMPGLLGAGAEFIPNKALSKFNNDVIKLDAISENKTLLGYIYGGINSSESNIFWINDGTQSHANNQIYKVFLKEIDAVSADDLATVKDNGLKLTTFPNPNTDLVNVQFNLSKKEDVNISIYDSSNRLLKKASFNDVMPGKNILPVSVTEFTSNYSMLIVSLEVSGRMESSLLILD